MGSRWATVLRACEALQLTPHFHILVPEVVFEEVGESALRLHPLPPPTDAEVERLAITVARRVLCLLQARRVLEEESLPDGALDVLQLEGIQVPRSRPRPPAHRPGRRCAFVEGFSLHADTWLHENDATGLERLCNYGARGPLALERLSAPPPGPSSSTCGFPPGLSPSPGGGRTRVPEGLGCSPLGECRPRFETRPGLTTGPGLLYTHRGVEGRREQRSPARVERPQHPGDFVCPEKIPDLPARHPERRYFGDSRGVSRLRS